MYMWIETVLLKYSIDGVYIVMGYDVCVYLPVYKLVCAELVCTIKLIICVLNLIICAHGLLNYGLN